MENQPLLVYCTCPDVESAEAMATSLVAEHLAACVNVLPAITSFYIWAEELQRTPEVLLLIKTTSGAYPMLEARIREKHEYEVPEIIAVPIVSGSADYLHWLNASCGAI